MRPQASLRGARRFGCVLRSGRRQAFSGMSVHSKPRSGGTTRLGLAVRVGSGGAVARNRVRRRLRAAAAEGLPRRGWDVVIRADERVNARSFQVLREELASATREVDR